MRSKAKSAKWITQIPQKIFLEDKLNNVSGYLIVLSVAIIFGYLLATQSLLGFGLFGLIIGLFTIIVCLLNTEAGLYINIIYSFFAFHFNRFLFNDNLQVGVGSDILVVATVLSLFIGKKKNFQFPKGPVVVCLLIMYGYIVIELVNPYAHSFLGWYQTLRKILAEFFLLLIAYNAFTSFKIVKRFITILFILCTICGIYGCIQQWHGLFNFEIAWATADEHRFGLIFIAGDYRKFSTMSDPTAYAIIMASCGAFFLVVATGQKKMLIKIILLVGVMFMFMGMGYSGTRTANAMLIAGLALFIILSFNKKSTRLFAILASISFLVLLYGPYSNSTINRFRTTFLGSEDESYKVRLVNKAFIQPYIYSHPFGGGLGTTGAGGLRYSPSHVLAGFPPDSGYLKMALEIGWIGLAILCLIYYNVLRNGVKVYFASKNENLKIIYAACVTAFFCLFVGQFAQDAIGQITDIVVYYPLIAITLRAKTLEQEM